MNCGLRYLLLAAGLVSTPMALAQGWVIGPFIRPVNDPVIKPNAGSYFTDPLSNKVVHWESLHTFNPAATIAPDGKIAVIYRAEDDSGKDEIGGHTSRLGLAFSTDGLKFLSEAAPVLYTEDDYQKEREFPGGVEDPRIVVAPDGTYVMTYTQWARNRGRYDIGIATSTNLEDWKKWGPAFGDGEGTRFNKLNYKSGGILTELSHGRIQAVKLHGKYWMYWGEVKVHLATSPDLIHWTPVLDDKGLIKTILSARKGRFDSGFPEVGPPPLLTKKGIVLIYNAKNADPKDAKDGETVENDPKIAPGAYSVGEALFSASDPSKLEGRTDKPVIKPEWPYERTGQYTAGTTFAEGLVAYDGQYFLYYGAADSFVGVARAELPR
jgi:predicted GH43/DUF377 family glycosyl hydrolase